MLLYDTIVKDIYNNPNGKYLNAERYLQTLKKAHIFCVNDQIIRAVQDHKIQKEINDEALEQTRLLMPFDNMWIDFPHWDKPNTLQLPIDITGGVRTGMHIVKMADDGVTEYKNPMYALSLFTYFDQDQRIFPQTAMFGVKSSSLAWKEWSFRDKVKALFRKPTEALLWVIWATRESELCDGERTRRDKQQHYQISAVNSSEIVAYHRFVTMCDGTEPYCQLGTPCKTSQLLAFHNARLAVALIGWINLPIHRIIKVSPILTPHEQKFKNKGIKPYGWKREHYIVLTHDILHTINPNYRAIETKSGSKRRPHARRGHKRRLYGRRQNGKWISYKKLRTWVSPAWIGPKEWQFEQNIYKLVEK